MALWLSVETMAIIAKPKKAKRLTVQRKNGRILIAYFETFPPTECRRSLASVSPLAGGGRGIRLLTVNHLGTFYAWFTRGLKSRWNANANASEFVRPTQTQGK